MTTQLKEEIRDRINENGNQEYTEVYPEFFLTAHKQLPSLGYADDSSSKEKFPHMRIALTSAQLKILGWIDIGVN